MGLEIVSRRPQELYENIARVSVVLTNKGDVAGSEVAQLYIQAPGSDTRALRGFAKEFLRPGASVSISFKLRKKDVSEWDSVSSSWVIPKGTHKLFVGSSVLDIKSEKSYEFSS